MDWIKKQDWSINAGHVIAAAILVGVFYVLMTGNDNSKYVEIGMKIYSACELAMPGSQPDMKPTQLPNGNIGYAIICK